MKPKDREKEIKSKASIVNASDKEKEILAALPNNKKKAIFAIDKKPL